MKKSNRPRIAQRVLPCVMILLLCCSGLAFAQEPTVADSSKMRRQVLDIMSSLSDSNSVPMLRLHQPDTANSSAPRYIWIAAPTGLKTIYGLRLPDTTGTANQVLTRITSDSTAWTTTGTCSGTNPAASSFSKKRRVASTSASSSRPWQPRAICAWDKRMRRRSPPGTEWGLCERDICSTGDDRTRRVGAP